MVVFLILSVLILLILNPKVPTVNINYEDLKKDSVFLPDYSLHLHYSNGDLNIDNLSYHCEIPIRILSKSKKESISLQAGQNWQRAVSWYQYRQDPTMTISTRRIIIFIANIKPLKALT